MVNLNPKYDYPKLKRVDSNGQRLYDTGLAKVPSVTTILGRLKDMTGINKWRERVGKEEAQRILTEAANLGTCTHKNIEQHLFGKERKSDGNLIHQIAYKLADVVIEQGLTNIDEVCGCEVSLYSPELYAGTTDYTRQSYMLVQQIVSEYGMVSRLLLILKLLVQKRNENGLKIIFCNVLHMLWRTMNCLKLI